MRYTVAVLDTVFFFFYGYLLRFCMLTMVSTLRRAHFSMLLLTAELAAANLVLGILDKPQRLEMCTGLPRCQQKPRVLQVAAASEIHLAIWSLLHSELAA